MCALPGVVAKILFDSVVEVMVGLFQVEGGDVVVCDFAGDHETANGGFAALVEFAGYRARGEAFAVGGGDEEGAAGGEEMVACEVVDAAEEGGGDVVAEGEGGDGVVVVIEEVEDWLGLVVGFGFRVGDGCC